MSRICEHHSDVLTNQQILPQFMNCVTQAIRDKPRISNQCCQALERLAVSCEPISNEQVSNAITPYFQVVLGVLNENTLRDDFAGSGVDLVQATYVSMTTLV